MGDTVWNIADFRPAPLGWRLVFLNRDTSIRVEPMPGWIILEEREQSMGGDSYLTGDRRITAAMADGAEVFSVDELGDLFWYVLAPDEPEPTQQDGLDEVKRRRQVAALPAHLN